MQARVKLQDLATEVATNFNPSPLSAYVALGGTAKAEPPGASMWTITSNNNLTSGVLRVMSVWLPKPATLTGVMWYQTTQGVYTASNYNGVGLYSYSGGTMTLVASSTNDGTCWSTFATNIWAFKDFSGTYVAVAGLYYIGILYSASATTTAPGIASGPNFNTSNVVAGLFTNSAKISGSLTSQTSLPSPQSIASINTHTQNIYVAAY